MRQTVSGLKRRLTEGTSKIKQGLTAAWMTLRGNTVVSTRQYADYGKYVDHQKEKTCDSRRIEKWKGEEWRVKYDGFMDIYRRNWEYLESRKQALCLGARTGQEVKALLDLGIQALGVDLVPFPPYTVEGDIHDLKYDPATYDFVFTNIFDHALYPEKFCAEMERVTMAGGVIMVHLQLGIDGDEYTETVVFRPDSVIAMFDNVEVLESRRIQNTFDGMNWEIILRKKAGQ
jgi:SAM-dependent methyltransferase